MKKSKQNTALTLCIMAFCVYLAIQFWPSVGNLLGKLLLAVSPLFVGFCLAYIINLPMAGLESVWFPKSKKKWVCASRRPICLVLAILAFLAVIALVIGLVLPQLIDCIKLIIEKVPFVINMGIDFLKRSHLLPDDIIGSLETIDWQSRVDQILGLVTDGVTGVVGLVYNTVSGVISSVFSALISVIFAIYILLSKDKLLSQCRRLSRAYLPKKVSDGAEHVLHVMNVSFRRYIVGQGLEAVILGSLCALGMLIFRIPYPAMIGTLIAFTALIPIAGAYVGGAVSALMILSVDPMKALIFLVFLVVLQQLEGNLIYPKVVGSSLKLPGLWVLFAVTVGGGIAGVGGMLLGVPLVATFYRLLSENLNKREEEAARSKAKEAALPDSPEESEEPKKEEP